MARRENQTKRTEWHFFSFPVLSGFLFGALVATLLAPFGGLVFLVSLFGVSFCLAHIISHWFRNRSIDKALQRAEDDERERRALLARQAASREGAAASVARRRRRRRT
jgi:hypothetical protein